jgi:hypothetical protein
MDLIGQVATFTWRKKTMDPIKSILLTVMTVLITGALSSGCFWLFGGDDDWDDSEPDYQDTDSDTDFFGCEDGYWAGDVVIEQIYDMQKLQGCRYIQGNLSVVYGDFTNLYPLHDLLTIGGDLRIEHNDSLTSLQGLDSLLEVEGNCYISDNNSLWNLNHLTTLVDIGGNLVISANNSLESLEGSDSLLFIGGDLRISSNMELMDIEGLDKLLFLDGDYLEISNNLAFPSCEADDLIDRILASGFTCTIDIHGNDDTTTCED